jgi:hypothetical protein
MIGAAKGKMLSGFGPWCADPALAVSVELAENSRQGFERKNPALHLGQWVANSRTPLGLPICCSKTALGPAVAANNGKSICSGAAGKTIPVNAPFGQMRFQFNGSGNLVGVGLQLTGMNGVSGNGLSIPPNTFAGFTQLSPGTVQFGFSNPVNVGSGFSQAYFQTATFSGGRFTSVQGAYAPLGIPLGSSSGNSSLMQWFLNGNSSTASQAQNFGNLLNSVASLVSSNVSCQAVFGGG